MKTSLIISAETIKEALKIAADEAKGLEGDPDSHLIIDIEGNWDRPPAFAKVEPGDELKIIGVSSIWEGVGYPPPTRGWVPASSPDPADLVQSYEVLHSDQKREPYKPSSPAEGRRAEAAKRLGGGPVVREKRVRDQESGRTIKMMLDGLRSRPVL